MAYLHHLRQRELSKIPEAESALQATTGVLTAPLCNNNLSENLASSNLDTTQILRMPTNLVMITSAFSTFVGI